MTTSHSLKNIDQDLDTVFQEEITDPVVTPSGVTVSKTVLDAVDLDADPTSRPEVKSSDTVPNKLYIRLTKLLSKHHRSSFTNEKLRKELTCKLSGRRFVRPVVAVDGETYERDVLLKYLEMNDNKLPVKAARSGELNPNKFEPGKVVQSRELYPNQFVVELMKKDFIKLLLNETPKLTKVEKTKEDARKEAIEQTKELLICPLSFLSPIPNPCITPQGTTYDLQQLSKWIRQQANEPLLNFDRYARTTCTDLRAQEILIAISRLSGDSINRETIAEYMRKRSYPITRTALIEFASTQPKPEMQKAILAIAEKHEDAQLKEKFKELVSKQTDFFLREKLKTFNSPITKQTLIKLANDLVVPHTKEAIKTLANKVTDTTTKNMLLKLCESSKLNYEKIARIVPIIPDEETKKAMRRIAFHHQSPATRIALLDIAIRITRRHSSIATGDDILYQATLECEEETQAVLVELAEELAKKNSILTHANLLKLADSYYPAFSGNLHEVAKNYPDVIPRSDLLALAQTQPDPNTRAALIEFATNYRQMEVENALLALRSTQADGTKVDLSIESLRPNHLCTRIQDTLLKPVVDTNYLIDLLHDCLTDKIYQEPVVASDGETYELNAIKIYVEMNGVLPNGVAQVGEYYPNRLIMDLLKLPFIKELIADDLATPENLNAAKANHIKTIAEQLLPQITRESMLPPSKRFLFFQQAPTSWEQHHAAHMLLRTLKGKINPNTFFYDNQYQKERCDLQQSKLNGATLLAMDYLRRGIT